MNIYFQNIRLINPANSIDLVVNLHIIDGKIVHCDASKSAEFTETTQVVDGTNLIVAPGFIDIHTHFREPGFTHKETLITGAAAAANGGFTEVVVMPNTNPALDSTLAVEYIKNKTADFLTKVHIAAAITQGRGGETLANMHTLAGLGVVYFTDDGSCVRSAQMMKKAFEYAAEHDYLLAQHCEEHTLTENFAMNESDISMQLGLKGYPAVAEEIIIARDIRLADYYRDAAGLPRRYHVQHLSTAKSVGIIRAAKSENARVSCEVTPHHLWFTDNCLLKYDVNYKMNPPLRKQVDITGLISGLRDGTIDCIASDHAPHAAEECEVEFERAPNGIIGLETSIGAVLTKLHHEHKFSISDIVGLMSIHPRRLLGLAPVEIAVGERANLTILDLAEEWVVDKEKFKSKGRNCPFDKLKFTGKPKYAINNGRVVECEL